MQKLQNDHFKFIISTTIPVCFLSFTLHNFYKGIKYTVGLSLHIPVLGDLLSCYTDVIMV